MKVNDFVQRALKKIPQRPVDSFTFESWQVKGKVTQRAWASSPFLVSCQTPLSQGSWTSTSMSEISITSKRAALSQKAASHHHNKFAFLQRVKIPVIGSIQQELVITDLQDVEGYRVAFWELLQDETMALNPKKGIRSQYNDGAWIVTNDVVADALSTAPNRDDVGLLKWKALTKVADAGAPKVMQNNIQGMHRWTLRHS